MNMIIDMPDDVKPNITKYLPPPEVYKLVCLFPGDEQYRKQLKSSLNYSLENVLLQGSTKFCTSTPLQSFVEMTKTLPIGEKVYLSGSGVLQAVLGSSPKLFEGSDLDIYCTFGAAPHVRRWLVGRDVSQVCGGYSELYRYGAGSMFAESSRNNPICHVEYYINKESIEYCDCRCITYDGSSQPLKLKDGRSFRLTTNDEKHPVTCVNYADVNKEKKSVVNLDLIVLKPGRSPQEALSDFDLICCGCSFDGDVFRIPNPDQTFTSQTSLGFSVDAAVTQAYIANLTREAQRDIHEVALEMKLPQKFKTRQLLKGVPENTIHDKYLCLVSCLRNIFKNSNKLPTYPFVHPEKDISFLKLVFEVRSHLISNAIKRLSKQGYNTGYADVPYSDQPYLFHNMIINQNVSRYFKYTRRGIKMEGWDPDSYLGIGVLQEVENFWDASKGMSDYVALDYYIKDMDMNEDSSIVNEDSDKDVSDGGDIAVFFAELFD